MGEGPPSGRIAALLIATLVISGCGNVLPRAQEETLSPWQTYDEAKASFDQIVVGETTVPELSKLGFDPHLTPNISHITYIDLLARFLPNQSIRMDDLDPQVSQCLLAREICYGLQFTPSYIDRQRYGNAFLDIFGFRRNTRITGWRFNGLIVIHDDLVVYTLDGGDANINQLEKTKRPLGPIQEMDIRGSIDLN